MTLQARKKNLIRILDVIFSNTISPSHKNKHSNKAYKENMKYYDLSFI